MSKRFLLASAAVCVAAGCDDPVPGPIGGVQFSIRTIASPEASRFSDAESVAVDYSRVVALGSRSDGSEHETVLDSESRRIVLDNGDDEIFVAQFQVPAGELDQIRIFADVVTIGSANGEVALRPGSSDLPSWGNTGWKVVPDDGSPFTIVGNEVTGLRATFDFADRLVRPGNTDWKVKPTIPAVQYSINPGTGEPGVHRDKLTIVFESGTPRTRIDEINAEMDATIVKAPRLTSWYRVKIPPSHTLEEAARYYKDVPEVVAIMPATDFAPHAYLPNDGGSNEDRAEGANLLEAWDEAKARTAIPIAPRGFVGTHAVEVAVIDGTGFDLTHEDMYQNFGVNQGELPSALFDLTGDGIIQLGEISVFDCYPLNVPDRVISIEDLECFIPGQDCPFPDCMEPTLPDIVPPDGNGNGRVDGEDVVNAWSDTVDDDANDFVDDLIGWNFGNDTNLVETEGEHGTMCASVVGAIGDNGKGIAGVNWDVSIVPIKSEFEFCTDDDSGCGPAGSDEGAFPDVSWSDTIAYVSRRNVDVVSISMGWHFAADGIDLKCGDKNWQTTGGLPREEYSDGVAELAAGYSEIEGLADTNTLFVISAGNSRYDLDDADVTAMPQEPLNFVISNRLLIVGASSAEDPNKAASFSDYGLVDLFAPGESWTLLTPNDQISIPSDGTSFAAPAVAGAAALLAALKPEFRHNARGLHDAVRNSAGSSLESACADSPFDNGRTLDARALLDEEP